MKNFNVVIGALVGAVIGFAVRSQMSNSTPGSAPAAAQRPAAEAKPSPSAEPVYKVLLGQDSPQKGPSEAKVTIVEFSDFQCPYCARVLETVNKVEQTYKGDVRIVFKQNPLAMLHPDATYAAKAGIAAFKQGKFWQMHDKMFEATAARKQDGLKPPALMEIAREIGLDTDKFKADVDSPEVAQLLGSDQAQARVLGANGTPTFFVNGVKVSGAVPFESFKSTVDAALKRADEKLASGVSRAQLYDALIKDGISSPPPPQAPAQQAAPPPQARKVEFDDTAPAKGGKAPKATIVVWSDFQCPYCSRVEPTLKQVEDTYKDDVRIVWRNQPLSFHPNAMPAAKAAMAAHKQGKFWQMHDKMFANQAQLSEGQYEAWAKELGLDLARWKKDKESPEIDALIKKDMSAGSAVGADGTPTSFVNGKVISGAVGFDAFKALIDEQIAKANAELKKGTPQGKLYETLVADNVKSAPVAPAAAPAAPEAPVKVEIGSAPVLGNPKAPVTVVIFSDFQCPYCGRVEPTLKQLRDDYGTKVKFVWKNQPLSFHPNAMPAAEAAMAAHEQGKFWEMHDRFFANQQGLSPAFYEQTAKELGLDMGRFKASVEAHKHKAAIEADSAEGNRLGAGGTPTFFINGRKLVGAVPVGSFKEIIDAELAAQVAKK
jgi:protein-disulfide isomerase